MKKLILGLLFLLLVGCSPAVPVTLTGETKELEITAHNFAFEPALISVNLGDHVKLLVTSADNDHGISIPALGVNAPLPVNKVTIVEFDATKKGMFEFRCNTYCGEGHNEMIGAIEVN